MPSRMLQSQLQVISTNVCFLSCCEDEKHLSVSITSAFWSGCLILLCSSSSEPNSLRLHFWKVICVLYPAQIPVISEALHLVMAHIVTNCSCQSHRPLILELASLKPVALSFFFIYIQMKCVEPVLRYKFTNCT